jgi:DNA-binding LytR/AlgR family response regulator
MKVLVVDDEPLARRRLIRMLARIEGIEVVGEACDVVSARERLRAERPELLFLDIDMPGSSGLDLARSGEALPPIVFITAYKQYALDAFEVSAVDYLVKPISPERLAAAIEKARRWAGSSDASRLEALLDRLDGRGFRSGPSRLHARFGGTTRLVDASEVTRITASAKYALFRHEGRELVLDESLNELEVRLADDGFMRIHRAELVNLGQVRALHAEDGATTVELSDGQRVPVSRRLVVPLKKRLGIARSRGVAAIGEPIAASVVERRLAAILSADVVGYSRLMAEDEVTTLRTLTARRDEVERLVRAHRGRVVDAPGDNLLAEFAGPTDAVCCALAIQRELREVNAPLPPARRMLFRIGIHLGEVMVEGARIYGAGVNTAARLEGLAEPGGICVSAIVREQVEGKLDAAFEDGGEQVVKNSATPLRLFRIAAP